MFRPDMEDMGAAKNRFKRISKPLSELKPHYEVVVIGSGYGGGVAASRMSRAGKTVCLLERGKEFLPGDYPDTTPKALEELQVDSPECGKVGSPTGLFNLHMGKDQAVMVGCGLGGTSLINANVSLEATPDVFEDDNWPETFRDNSSVLLQEGYQRAREMLRPNEYPSTYPDLRKYEAHQKSANGMGKGQYFKKTPINVTFETPDSGVNHVGVPQVACNNCGDCVSGCNVGAKNTTLMNYLPDAFNHGAEIFCEIHVEYLEKAADGTWLVHYTLPKSEQEKFNASPMTISADMVMLAAGTVGSCEIMLRTRKETRLSLSDQLGRRFSGNGDILGFGYNCEDKIDGIGYGNHDPKGLSPVGPCITSVIDLRVEGTERKQQMVIEEGSIPGGIGKPFAALMNAANRLYGVNTVGGIQDVAQKLFRRTFFRAASHTQTYLIMSHDDGRGVLRLNEEGRLEISWPGVGKQANFEIGNKRMEEATAELKGNYVKNPMWTELFGKDVISVHPLGGCCMASNATNGVVDHKGRVFSGRHGEEVHKGLYICDGSVIPTSLAVNPLLTITAVAERTCALIAQEQGLTINYDLPSATKRPHYEPKLGIEFTETMRGTVSAVGEQGPKQKIHFTLTVRSDDLETLLNTPEHRAQMNGTVVCPALDIDPLSVVNGEFQLFVEVPHPPGTRHMVYAMPMYTRNGKAYFLYGYKLVQDKPNPLRIWHDTSTLYVTIYEGLSKVPEKAVFSGVMHIRITDFAKQMTTMRVLNAKSEVEKLSALARFGKYFAGVLWETYGGVLAPRDVYNPDLPPRQKRPLDAPAPEVHYFTTEDQVTLRLTRYKAGTKGPVMLVHGLGVSSQIFSTDLIDVNLLEYLCKHEYDVWLLDMRVSILLPASNKQSNGDQVARFDYPAAVNKIREVTNAPSVQAVVHCWGAATFFMSMLAGLEGIRSIVCSQVATEAVMKLVTNMKSTFRLPDMLGLLGFKYLTTYVDTNENIAGRAIDRGLAVYAMMEAQGQCNSPVCHRITFNYASLFRHDQLNQRLHENLHELFAEANISAFEHLALICRRGHLVSADGKEDYLPNLERLKLPILFISGANNDCYLPESTNKTYTTLCEKFGEENYSRTEIAGYGHIDCIFGRNAHQDVFPSILKHLEATATY